MSYLDHIKRCNEFQENQYHPFFIDGACYGLCRLDHIEHLKRWPEVFQINEQGLFLHPSLQMPMERTLAVESVMQSLFEQQIIDSWVGEQYSVSDAFNGTSKMLLERAAVAFLGVQGYGIHLNGLVRKSDGIYVWVAERSKSKPFWPGQLDQIVAGGQPEGLGLMENLIKEAAEEAAISEDVTQRATFANEIRYCSETHRGLNNDGIFAYDLWLDEDFVPVNTDGEVESFTLLPIEEMARITDTSDQFKDNCNLVNIDLLLRLGYIDANHRDYTEIVNRLYATPTPLTVKPLGV